MLFQAKQRGALVLLGAELLRVQELVADKDKQITALKQQQPTKPHHRHPGWPLTPIHRNCSGFSSQVVSQQARAGLSGGGCVCLYGGSSSAGCMTAACHSIHATQHHIASPFTACHWRGKSLLCPAACICHGLSHMQRDAQCGEIDCVACPCRLP